MLWVLRRGADVVYVAQIADIFTAHSANATLVLPSAASLVGILPKLLLESCSSHLVCTPLLWSTVPVTIQ